MIAEPAAFWIWLIIWTVICFGAGFICGWTFGIAQTLRQVGAGLKVLNDERRLKIVREAALGPDKDN